MGQNVHAVLLGVKVGEPPEKFTVDDGDGWHDFIADANGAAVGSGYTGLCVSCHYDEGGLGEGQWLIGAWIAIGRYGDGEVPGLDTPIRLDKMIEDDPHKSAIMAAERSFAIAREWALAQGVDLGEPTLWLTTTEVA